ncbi:MAG: hypothetical protein Q7T53_02330 [Deltaproteobacteria bacterium]|nr:hypothetical protein [Deltaproteobacteria bacterium]
MNRILAAVLGCFFILGAASDGFCLMLPARIQDLVKRSDVIIIGEVLDVTIEENTYVRIKVIQYLKNKPNDERSEVIIRTLLHGKEADETIWYQTDEPEFEAGEQVFLFLKKDTGIAPFGGKYTTKDYIVSGNLHGKHQIKDNKVDYRDTMTGKSASIPLERFIPELKKVIEDPIGHMPNFFNDEEDKK